MHSARSRVALPAALAVLSASVALPAGPAQARSERGVSAAVSIMPQAWLVRELGGDRVRVITLVGSGESPHSYQPTDRQVSEVMRADLYFRVGIPLEEDTWFRAIRQADRVRIVDMREGIRLRDMHAHCAHDHPHHHEHAAAKDPHIWLDPELLAMQAETVATALIQVDPDHAEAYRSNLSKLRFRLDELDKSIAAALEPHRGKSFFVFHPAWGYFCDRYGLRQIAVEIDGKEPTDSELTELQRQATKQGARIIFVQPQITGRAAKAVADSIGGRVEVADPLAPDVPENLEKMARAIAASYRN